MRPFQSFTGDLAPQITKKDESMLNVISLEVNDVNDAVRSRQRMTVKRVIPIVSFMLQMFQVER